MNEKIEKINIKDINIAREILKIQKEAYKIEAEIIDYYDLPPLKETENDLINFNQEFWAYKSDNKICGIISFEVNTEYLDISKLFVATNYLNKGIGSKLLKAVEEKLENTKYIKVSTGFKNIPAINFYKKHNFNLVNVFKVENDLEIAEFRKKLINIRKASEKDLTEIKDLLGSVWDNTYKDVIPENIINKIKSTAHSIENLKSQINSNIIFNVAEEKDQIIGVLSAIKKDDKHYLKRLYVLSNQQKKGIGKKLLNNFIKNNQVQEIILEVAENNQQAINFYQKEGFVVISDKIDMIKVFNSKSLIMSKIIANQ